MTLVMKWGLHCRRSETKTQGRIHIWVYTRPDSRSPDVSMFPYLMPTTVKMGPIFPTRRMKTLRFREVKLPKVSQLINNGDNTFLISKSRLLKTFHFPSITFQNWLLRNSKRMQSWAEKRKQIPWAKCLKMRLNLHNRNTSNVFVTPLK